LVSGYDQMFDIGFWELVLVGVVSLLVFGPERLPRVAREAALWIQKARSMVASVKSEIDQELQIQELRQSLLEERRKLRQEVGMLKDAGSVKLRKADADVSRHDYDAKEEERDEP
jgi:sec-independent protein translocase protein TatB